jgi:choline kinase
MALLFRRPALNHGVQLTQCLCAKDAVKEPFAVINADDFYGRMHLQKLQLFCRKIVTAKPILS